MDDKDEQSSCLDDAIADNCSLLTEFRRHVYLGQWELARACALTVLRASFSTEDDKNFVKDYVKELAVCPEALSACLSPSVPSPHHLSWQAGKFLEENFPEEDAASLKNSAEFEILLHRVDLSKDCREELRRLYGEKCDGAESSPSVECRANLHRSLLYAPSETHQLLSHFLQHSRAEVGAAQFEAVYLRAALHVLKQVKLPSNSRVETKMSALHLLSLIPESATKSAEKTVSESATLLQSIFRDLVDLIDENALGEEEVLGSLACRKSPRLLQLFSNELNERRGRNDERALPVSPATGRLDIRESFLKSVISGKHFAETLLQSALKKVLEGDSETARHLLSDPLLKNLLPVALIVAWDGATSDESAINVMEAVRHSEGWNCSDPDLRNVLERLQYDLRVTDWISAVYRNRKPEMSPSEERTRRRGVFDMLLRHSPLCVIHKSLGLSSLNRDDLLELLEAAPTKSDTAPRDAVLYAGFLSLRCIMEAFYVAVVLDRVASTITLLAGASESVSAELWDISLDEESLCAALKEHGFQEVYRHTVLVRLDQFREEVCAIQPLNFRLELLEDAFSLLFVTRADLKQGEGADTSADTDYGRDSDESGGRATSAHAADEKEEKINEHPKVVAKPSKEASDSVSTKGSTASSSASPVGGSAAGFLCPHFLVPDVLQCLAGAIVSTQATAFALGAGREKDATTPEATEVPSAVSWKEFPTRLEALNKHVVEAQWRYDLVASSSNFRHPTVTRDAGISTEVNATVTSKDTKRSWKKRRRSSVRLDSGEPTVIEKMLSTFEALLRHCLWHGNFKKAHQIVELLDLGHSHDAQELSFSERLSETVQRIARLSNSPTPPPPSNDADALAEVDRAAREGLRLTSVASCVDRLLRSDEVPRISEAEALLRSTGHTSFASEYGSGGLVVAAVADLALGTELPCDVSERLLALAIGKRRSAVKPVGTGGSKWRGLVPTIERMRQFLHETSGMDSVGGLESILCVPGSSDSLTSLLCGYLGEMDPQAVRRQQEALRELGAQLNEVASLLQNSKAVVDLGGDGKNQLHKAFFRLTEISGSQLRTRLPFLPPFHFDYLRCIYAHVRQVHKAICDVARQGKLKVSHPGNNYFWVLGQSSSALLSSMVLKDEVPPVRLEDLAARTKINLVQVLARDCCPRIPLWRRRSTCDWLSSPFKILNDADVLPVEPPHPNYVVRCLLQDLIQLLKAYCDVGDCVVTLRDAAKLGRSPEFSVWASGCVELGSLDLSQLNDNASRLTFFLNLVNLLTLHTAILQCAEVSDWEVDAASFVPVTSPHVHQRLIAERQCGYRVGQLGAITLFQLKRQILFQGYPLDDVGREDSLLSLLEELDTVSCEKYAACLRPKVVFSLVQGRSSDPRLEVIYPETLETQLQAAVDRCMAQIKALSADGKRKIIFPWQMAFFIDSLVVLDAGSEELTHSLKRVIPEGFLVEFQKQDFTFGIVLDTPIPPSFSEQASSPTVARVPPAVLSYLENRCPLLGQLLKYMQPKVSKELRFEEGSGRHTPLEELLHHYYVLWAQAATPSGHGPWLSLALQGRASGPLLWEALQGAASHGDSVTALALLDLADAVEGLGSNPDLAAYKQLFLWLLASRCSEDEDKDGVGTEPWRFALCIEDPAFRVQCVLANYIRWPDERGVEVLETALADCRSTGESGLCARLSRELEKIALYKEVEEMSKGAPSSAFGSWRDVARLSLSDPALVLEQLSSSKCYGHGVRWAELHEVPPHCRAVVTELHILNHLHKDVPEPTAAFQIVSKCETEEEAFLLCRSALRRLPDGSGKIEALNFVLDNYAGFLTEWEVEEFRKVNMALHMYVRIDPRRRGDYAHLISRPDLLLEQLLMNSEVDCVGECLQAVSPFFDRDHVPLTREAADELLEKYASKALELLLLPMPSSEPETGLSSGPSPFPPEGAGMFTMPEKPPPEGEWVPDEKVAFCMVCHEERFGVFSRRHHCRRCGRVVCASCSRHSLPVEGYGKKNVRVCEDCFDQTVNPTTVGIEAVPAPLPSGKGLRFNPNESPSLSSLRSPRTPSSPLGGSGHYSPLWVLNLEDEENVFTRDHFYYERAPSVSLCLSILAKHSSPTRCATFILLLCDNLFAVLAPKASSDTLVDYGLIISMMSSLILSAKVKCEEASHVNGVEWCDAYLRRLDIVRLMVTNNCQHLIPDEMLLRSSDEVEEGLDPQRYWLPERKLRDRLIEAERMVLAMEVSTKCGLEKSGIFAAWGLAMLRAGDWLAAREKFSFCLQRPKDCGKSAVESPLLREVVTSLEKSLYPGISKAAAVFCAIASLKSIRDPGSEIKVPGAELKNVVFAECRYYLEHYGTHRSMLEFLLRHRKIRTALEYFLTENCDPELLMEQLLQPALVQGQLEEVLSEIRTLDPSLSRFWPGLLVACRHLQRSSLFHSLYRMQLFMEDFIRAAMTSIQFFEEPPARSYAELHGRLCHLANARSHFETYLERYATWNIKQTPKKGKPVFEMAPKEVNRRLSMVNLQIDITRFLNSREAEGKLLVCNEGVGDFWRPPTLFGNIAKKRELACLVLTNGTTVDEGFGLAFRIIQEHHLSGAQVFERTSEILQREKGGEQVRRLVGCIDSCGYPEKYDADAVVLAAIKVMVASDEERKDLDVLVKCLKSDTNKIEAYMVTGRLKSAYLLAVRRNQAEHVRRIMALAEEAGHESIRSICEKWLQKLAQR